MKVAVSIPDRVFRTADELAARLGVSRSQLYAEALAALVEKHREDVITSRLNEVYAPGRAASALEPDVVDLQSRSLELQRW
jgi:metal-responsive CopG/Arc/MetJ family transcriptional regulator